MVFFGDRFTFSKKFKVRGGFGCGCNALSLLLLFSSSLFFLFLDHS